MRGIERLRVEIADTECELEKAELKAELKATRLMLVRLQNHLCNDSRNYLCSLRGQSHRYALDVADFNITRSTFKDANGKVIDGKYVSYTVERKVKKSCEYLYTSFIYDQVSNVILGLDLEDEMRLEVLADLLADHDGADDRKAKELEEAKYEAKRLVSIEEAREKAEIERKERLAEWDRKEAERAATKKARIAARRAKPMKHITDMRKRFTFERQHAELQPGRNRHGGFNVYSEITVMVIVDGEVDECSKQWYTTKDFTAKELAEYRAKVETYIAEGSEAHLGIYQDMDVHDSFQSFTQGWHDYSPEYGWEISLHLNEDGHWATPEEEN